MLTPAFQLPPGLPDDWPHRSLSRQVVAGPLRWHVQYGGSGPLLLLLHGTGSSAHSWADAIPTWLAEATVLAVDIPGHGFTSGREVDGLNLTQIARDLDALLLSLGLGSPALVVGHSAGVALALRWAMDTAHPPGGIVGFNPSLVPPPALYTQLIGPVVSPLATSSLLASQIAKRASRGGLIERMLASTESDVPEHQRRRYKMLFSLPAHVRGTMGFMANADLSVINARAGSLLLPMSFVLGSRDPWVPEHRLRRILAGSYPRAKVVRWDGGHVLHEVEPLRAANLVLNTLRALNNRCVVPAAEPGAISPGG